MSLEEQNSEAGQPSDIKKQTLQFFGEKFNIDLHEHPEEWEKFYDLFKDAESEGMNLEDLIQEHLVEGKEIDSDSVMEILSNFKEELGSLRSKLNI